MSEEVPQTADGAIRSWFTAAGFTCVLLGGEMIVLHSAISAGIFLLIASAPFYWAAYKWPWLKPKLDIHALRTINSVATDARWWVALFFVFLIAISFSSQQWYFVDLAFQWPWPAAFLIVAIVAVAIVLFPSRRPQRASIEIGSPTLDTLAMHTWLTTSHRARPQQAPCGGDQRRSGSSARTRKRRWSPCEIGKGQAISRVPIGDRHRSIRPPSAAALSGVGRGSLSADAICLGCRPRRSDRRQTSPPPPPSL
jgi:hypothetical protein